MSTQTADLAEHTYISQFSQPVFGVTTRASGSVSDPDSNSVLVTMTSFESVDVFVDRAATRIDEGMYEVNLSSVDTQDVGAFNLKFSYATSTTPQISVVPIQIGGASAAYDNLSDEMKRVVESVCHRFADLYDSPIGGPHLQTYMQTHFGRGRIAQLMAVGLGQLNTIAQPHTTYTLENFPLTSWGALLDQSTYVEVLKHLVRSYVEQPNVQGASVTYLDRRDYQQRWQQVLQFERPDLNAQIDQFKMAHMGLGRPAVLVAGGVYGNYGPAIGGGYMAARPRYYYRFN